MGAEQKKYHSFAFKRSEIDVCRVELNTHTQTHTPNAIPFSRFKYSEYLK